MSRDTAAPGLVVRKLADTSKGTRVPGFHPVTGEKVLLNPETQLPESWPLLGVVVEGEVPDRCKVPTSWVARGREEGWIVGEGHKVVHRSGGPKDNEWAVTHTFEQFDYIVLKAADGDVRFRVAHQPDKYIDKDGAHVDWFYVLEREA